MKTIEQYEAQIAQQTSLIKEGLLALEENIHVIPNVVGKDPQYVYDLLTRKFDETYGEYMTTTLRNLNNLDYYTQKFDKIIVVLADAERQIEKAKSGEGLIDAGIGEISEVVEGISEDLEVFLDETINVQVEKKYIGMAITGAGSFLVMRLLGFGFTTSLIGAGVSSYLLVGSKTKVTEPTV